MQTSFEIGNKIVTARKLKGITQVELAKEMSVTPQAVGKWERGESMPDIITFNKLANVLNTDLNYFSKNNFNENIPKSSLEILSTEEKQNNKKSIWDMSGSIWENSDFSGISGLGKKLSGANIKNCKFNKSDLSSLTLGGNNLSECDFSESNFKKSKFLGSTLKNSNFLMCQFLEAVFSGCTFQNSDFEKVNFSGAIFKGSHFNNSNLNRADFSKAIFKASHFSNSSVEEVLWNKTHFSSSGFSDMIFSGEINECTFIGIKPIRTIFRNLTIKNSFFKFCNLKKLKFENCKVDNITLAFLQNNKADVSGILSV